MYDAHELTEVLVPLLILKTAIYQETALQPTMMMLPHHSVPDGAVIYGLPVMPGDRAALIYEPPRRK